LRLPDAKYMIEYERATLAWISLSNTPRGIFAQPTI